ncbi:acetate and sugar kinases/Hsc70/actin family protein [Streptomyces luteolus]|uniref:Uncharacterized protein n=1 Tax=Streptomyces luteolus TaxID=3043615 RepID=A0ABT6SSM1_9ACTN|nr:hypothetical protein [Streptomyces sp. B-S-A12]MDI3418578.1 hypothetical protein [Streptomyces sp. B-S-A12]
MSDPLVVVGIDLGTFASGFAWAVIDEQNDDPKKRTIHFFTQWPGQPVASVKNLSALLLNESDEAVTWGFEARERALTHLSGINHKYRAAFKMQLMHNHDRQEPRTAASNARQEPAEQPTEEGNTPLGAAPNSDEEDETGDDDDERVEDLHGFTLGETPSEAEMLTTALLSRIREAALQQVTVSGYLEEDIRWCITVPAIFGDRTKHLVRRCAAAAGFPKEDGRLILALEPEAAVHYARVSGARAPGSDTKSARDLAAPGRLILVVDGGGGTVDLAAYRNDEHGRMVEVGLVNGAQHGSNELNRRFEDRILADRFGKPELVEQLRQEAPEAMLHLCEDWERGKLSFGPDSEEDLYLPIPTAIDRKLGASVRKRIARKQRGVTDYIVIPPKEMKDVFDTAVSEVLDLVDDQLDEIGGQAPAATMPVVLMAGGFSNSPYLQHSLKDHLAGRAHVLLPPDPGAAVLHGAVHFAYAPQTRARRARYTYGVAIAPPFDPDKDPEKLRFIDSEGLARCSRRFAKLVTIGDVVDTGEEIMESLVPICPGRSTVNHALFATTEKDARYVTDPGCEFIGKLSVDLSTVMKYALPDRGTHLYLSFGETEIKVRSVVERTGAEVSTTLHFASDY